MSYIWQNFMEKKIKNIRYSAVAGKSRRGKRHLNVLFLWLENALTAVFSLSLFWPSESKLDSENKLVKCLACSNFPQCLAGSLKANFLCPFNAWEKDLARNQFLPKAAQPVSTKRNVERTKLESESPNCSFVILKTKSFSFHVQEYLGTYLKNTASSL